MPAAQLHQNIGNEASLSRIIARFRAEVNTTAAVLSVSGAKFALLHWKPIQSGAGLEYQTASDVANATPGPARFLVVVGLPTPALDSQ